MTNPYITKLNELIADINENEIASHDNPKSLKGWCEKWREEATMCSIALFTELSCLNEISDMRKPTKPMTSFQQKQMKCGALTKGEQE